MITNVATVNIFLKFLGQKWVSKFIRKKQGRYKYERANSNNRDTSGIE